MDSANPPGYEGLTLAQFLGEVSSTAPTPASGSVAAVTLSLAAGLCAKCARLSTRQMSDAAELAERADALAGWAAALANADARAYDAVIAASGEARAEALADAADDPLDVARVAVLVAEIAARLAEFGNRNLLGDAVTAAQIAAGAARSAAALVAINLAERPLDPRRAEADDAVRAVERECARARTFLRV